MSIRLATLSDIPRILTVYATARDYMKKNGNPDQWGNLYPSRALLEQDIEGGFLWVIADVDAENSSENIVGVFAFFPEGDPIYNNIEGKWLNDLPHSAIHRVASSGERRGILAECIGFCLESSKNLKIDTHKDNLTMQNALKKQGFVFCGRIFLENKEERLAFQKYKAE